MKSPKKLFLIAIIGPSGAGKTTLAELLKGEISNTALIGSGLIERFISGFGGILSHDQTTRKVIKAMATEYLKNDINVIIEQGMNREELEQLETIASDCRANFLVYRIETSKDVLYQRANEKAGKLGKLMMMQGEMEERFKKNEGNDYPRQIVLNSERMSSREMVDKVLEDVIGWGTYNLSKIVSFVKDQFRKPPIIEK